MKKQFIVTVELPSNVNTSEMRKYISTAVKCWAGGLDPLSDLFYLNPNKVTVKPIKEEKK